MRCRYGTFFKADRAAKLGKPTLVFVHSIFAIIGIVGPRESCVINIESRERSTGYIDKATCIPKVRCTLFFELRICDLTFHIAVQLNRSTADTRVICIFRYDKGSVINRQFRIARINGAASIKGISRCKMTGYGVHGGRYKKNTSPLTATPRARRSTVITLIRAITFLDIATSVDSYCAATAIRE